MRIVAKIPYIAVPAKQVEEIEKLAIQGFSFHVFCDADMQEMVLVV